VKPLLVYRAVYARIAHGPHRPDADADSGYVYGDIEVLKQLDVRRATLDSLKPKPPRVSLKGDLGAARLADPGVTADRLKQARARRR
jgi:hypothetical protein